MRVSRSGYYDWCHRGESARTQRDRELTQCIRRSHLGALTRANFSNALVIVAVSLIVGAIFGLLSGKLGGILARGDQGSEEETT